MAEAEAEGFASAAEAAGSGRCCGEAALGVAGAAGAAAGGLAVAGAAAALVGTAWAIEGGLKHFAGGGGENTVTATRAGAAARWISRH